jgi:hypothetical protein
MKLLTLFFNLILVCLASFFSITIHYQTKEIAQWRKAAATATYSQSGNSRRTVENPEQLTTAIGQYRMQLGESGYRQGN